MNAKLLELMKVLAAKTRANKVRWERLDEKMFRTSMHQGIVRIGRSEAPEMFGEQETNRIENRWIIEIWVMNEKGQIAEEERLKEVDFGFNEADELFRAARASSAGNVHADTVNSMLTALAHS